MCRASTEVRSILSPLKEISMKMIPLSAVVFTFAMAAAAYEIADENEVVSQTCRISVKAEVIHDETMEKKTGRAIVSVNLTDDDGNPYRGEEIEVVANGGTFVCNLPEDSAQESVGSQTDGADCFMTGDDGIAKLYLVNIPINQQIHIRANYDCGGRMINGSASLSISRAVVKKKKQVKLPSR